MMASASAETRERGWAPILLLGIVVATVLYLVRTSLPPLILAGIMAYLINPIIDISERRNIPRWASIAGVYLLIAGLIVLAFAYLVPLLVEQLQQLQQQLKGLWPRLPDLLRGAQEWVQEKIPASRNLVGEFQLDERAISTAQEWASGFLAQAPQFLTKALTNIVNVVSYFVMVPFIAFFLLRDGRSFKRGLIQLVPNRFFETTLAINSKIEEQVGRYLRGILLEASSIGVLSVIGLLVIGLDQAVIVGVVAGAANLVPYLGPIVGTLAGVLVAVSTGGSILGVLIVFASVQFIDNWVLQPVVMSRSVRLHPLLVFLAVIFGGTYGGLLGMVLAVPLTGAIVVTISTLREGLKPSADPMVRKVPD